MTPPRGTDENVRACIRILGKPPEPGTEKVVEYPDGLAKLLEELLTRRAWDRQAAEILRETAAECYRATFGKHNFRCARCGCQADCVVWAVVQATPKRRR